MKDRRIKFTKKQEKYENRILNERLRHGKVL